MPLGIIFALIGIPKFIGGNESPMYLKGLWLGAGISVTICSLLFVLLRCRIKWENEVERAQNRMEKEQQAIEKFKFDFESKLDEETKNKLLKNDDNLSYADFGISHKQVGSINRTFGSVSNVKVTRGTYRDSLIPLTKTSTYDEYDDGSD